MNKIDKKNISQIPITLTQGENYIPLSIYKKLDKISNKDLPKITGKINIHKTND